MLGCKNLGEVALLDGDTARAQTTWSKALRLASAECDRKGADGCYLAGDLVSQGKGAPRDPKRAAALMDRACTLGHAASCVLRAADETR